MVECPPRPVPLPVIFENIPDELRCLAQWVLWRYEWRSDKLKWDKPPYQFFGKFASATNSQTWTTFEVAQEAYENGLKLPVNDPLHFDGVGFVPRFDENAEFQIVLGDLDKCRDRDTGAISPEALRDLRSINSYCESSPSRTGLRFVARGAPPFPPGKMGRKKGRIELYQGGHYLTITGQRMPEYPATIETRPEELNAFYQKHFSESEPEQPNEEAQKDNDLKLTDERVMALAAQAHNSPKFLSLMSGSIEGYSSQSEADLALCQLIAFYTQDPAQIDRIFRRSGLFRDKWEREDYRQNTIGLALERTEEHYCGRGACGSGEPSLRMLTPEHSAGSVGVDPGTGCVARVTEITKPDGTVLKGIAWVSDCALHIHTETRAKDATEFIFCGTGARDKRPVKFTLSTDAASEPKRFRAALLGAFGARNLLGKIDLETVQKISVNPRNMRRVEVPVWAGRIPLVPGVDLASGVEYRLGAYTPAEVRAGDIGTAKERLRTLMRSHEYSPILVAVVLGAPAFARWHPNDRFGLGLWGESGSFKTTIAQLALAMFGEGYADDAALLKHGNAGTTIVGATTIFAFAGMLAQILDDVKTTNPKDSQSYVSLIHAVIEGKDKARGNKDGTLRDSKEFLCTPIITGEIRPEEASTTARVLNLVWSKAACNKDALTDVETHVSDLSIIGYHWLRFLAGSELNLVDGFNEARSKKFQEFSSKRYVNPGRLATIYTLVRSAWGLLRASPLGDVFDEFSSPFVESLDRAIEVQGQAVTGETELEKFMSGLREILASRPGIVQSLQGVTVLGSVIGKWTENGLFLLPTETLNELNKIRAFTQQPTVSSMTAALNAAGYLVADGRHLKKRVSLNGSQVRGWLIGPTSGIARPPCGLPETSDGEAHKTTKTTKTTPDEQENFSENFKKNHDRSVDEKDAHNSSGLSGLSGLVEERDREIDIDFDGTNDKTTHKTTASVSGLPSGRGEEQPGIGPHPRKDEPTPAPDIKLAAISEYGMSGWVDPAKLAHALKLPLPEVVAWLEANYVAYERSGGGTGYRQKRAGEASA